MPYKDPDQARAYHAAYRKRPENKQRRIEYDQSYYHTAEGKAVRIKAGLKYRATAKGKAADRRAGLAFNSTEKGKLARRAHWAVKWALETGKLIRQPCEVCGNAKAQAHHDDYMKPLEVRWLCSHDHAAHYLELRNGPA